MLLRINHLHTLITILEDIQSRCTLDGKRMDRDIVRIQFF